MEFKIVLVGDDRVGKTSFVERHKKGSFDTKYIPTQGVDVTPLTFNTNYGLITFKVWDCASQEKFGGLRDGYYYGADGAIVMFDLRNRKNNNVNKWLTGLTNIILDAPVAIVANKCDSCDKPDISHISINRQNCKLCIISAKTSFRYETPFLYLAQKLMNHDDLEFVEMSAVTSEIKSEVKPETKPKNNKKVSFMTNPNGGIIRVTYEFFEDGEVIDQ